MAVAANNLAAAEENLKFSKMLAQCNGSLGNSAQLQRAEVALDCSLQSIEDVTSEAKAALTDLRATIAANRAYMIAEYENLS